MISADRNAPHTGDGIGKHDHPKPCSVCEGFKGWTATQRASSSSSSIAPAKAEPPEDCPADLGRLGRHSWTLLHTIGATYPEQRPTEAESAAARNLIQSLSILFPCRHCADDLKQYISLHPPQTNDRTAFELWLCNAHNHVNRRTGKPTFDCSKLAQRWRDGWEDGRCDP